MQRTTRRWLIGGVITAALFFCIASLAIHIVWGKQNDQRANPPLTGVTLVALSGYALNPANIEVPVGTTVTWTNDDDAPHTITFDNGMADSGTFTKGQTYRYTFTQGGRFDYHCKVHPEMAGRVVVIP